MTAPELGIDREGRNRWERTGPGQRAAIVVVLGLLVLAVTASSLGGLVGGAPGGPVSSSFSTGASGLQAWADLLARREHPVTRQREPAGEARLDPASTIVVADPEALPEGDAVALAAFVAEGGRLVLVGPSTAPLVGLLVGAEVAPGRGAGAVEAWLPVPETEGVAAVAGGGGSISTPAPLVGVAGDAEGAAAVAVADVGAGRVVAVADADVFQNRNLARADNATLALAVVGPAGRPVVFVESVHGYEATGWAAVPRRAKQATFLAVAALLVGLWSAAARFGPPEPEARTLRPARREHVDAVAADLERVGVAEAERVAPLQAATRTALAHRLGAPADAPPAVLRAGAARAGIDTAEVDVLVGPVADRDHALAVGALAAASQRGVRRPSARPADPPSTPTSAAPPDVGPATVPPDPRTPGAPS